MGRRKNMESEGSNNLLLNVLSILHRINLECKV